MKYRVTQPFIAFGKTPEAGELIELTPEQAAILSEMQCVAPYETKIRKAPGNKGRKPGKQSASLHPDQAQPAPTRKRSRKKATK